MMKAEVIPMSPSPRSPSPRTISVLNIDHYRQKLKTETDPSKRQAIANLLAEEEAKLIELMWHALGGK